MAKGTKVRGITIELDGNVSPFIKSMKEAGSAVNATQKELRDINRLLKFDGRQPELLAQKQRVLNQAVDETEQKLKEAKHAYDAMANSPNSNKMQASMDALQREIIATEREFVRLKQQSILAGNTGNSAMAKFAYTMQRASNTLGRVSATTGKIGSGFKSVGSALSGVNRAVLGTATALAALTLRAGWSRMEAIDEARVKMKAIGMDAEDVAKAMDSASKSVSGTAFTLSDAASAAAQASAAGVKQGKEMDLYLQAIADSAAVAGVDLNEMANIFTKVATTNKAMTRELRQMSQRGIPIYQWLAKEMGVTTEEVGKLASQGKIDLATFRNAVTNNIGGAAQEMGSSTITGAIKNIRAGIARVGAAFLGSSDDANSFAGQIHDVLISIKTSINGMEEGAKGLGYEFGKTFKVIYTYFKTGRYYGDALGKTGRTVAGSIKAIIDAGRTASKLFGAMPSWLKTTTLFTAAFGAPLANAIGGAFNTVSRLTGALQKMTKAMAAESAMKAAQGSLSSFGRVGQSAATAVGTFSAKMSAAVASLKAAAPQLAVAGAAVGALWIAMRKFEQANNPFLKDIENAKSLRAEIEMTTDAYRDNAKYRQQTIDGVIAENKVIDENITRLLQLEGTKNKTNAQIAEEKSLVDQLNESIPDLNLAYDDQTGKLNMSAKALRDKASAYKEEAEAAAYSEAITEATKERIQAEAQLDEAQKRLTKAEKAWNKELDYAARNYGEGTYEYWRYLSSHQSAKKVYEEEKKTVDKLNKSVKSSQKEIDNYAAAQAGLKNETQKALNTLASEAGIEGGEIPKSLTVAIEQGVYEMPQSKADLKRLINIEEMRANARQSGINITDSMAQGFNSGTKSGVKTALVGLKQEVQRNLSGAGTGAYSKGQAVSTSYASGVTSGKGKASSAGSAVRSAVMAAIGKTQGAYNTGVNISRGVANGMDAGKLYALASAENVIGGILRKMKAAGLIKSPSRLFKREIGENIGLGVAAGIQDSTGAVVAAAQAQNNAMLSAYQGSPAITQQSQFDISGQMSGTLMQGFAVMANALLAAMPKDIAVNINGRQLAQAAWSDFANEGTRRGAMFAPTQNEVRSTT